MQPTGSPPNGRDISTIRRGSGRATLVITTTHAELARSEDIQDDLRMQGYFGLYPPLSRRLKEDEEVVDDVGVVSFDTSFHMSMT